MREHEFTDWVMLIVMSGIAVWFAINVFGCAHSLPPLTISEKQIDQKIEALLNKTPTDPEAVLYDAESDRYVVKPEAMKNAINDGIRAELYEEEILPDIQEYLAENPPATLGVKARWAGIGVIAGIILSVIGVVVVGGL